MDEFVDQLLTEERVCDIILPRLPRREVLEDINEIGPRKSLLLEVIEGVELSDRKSRSRSQSPSRSSSQSKSRSKSRSPRRSRSPVNGTASGSDRTQSRSPLGSVVSDAPSYRSRSRSISPDRVDI